MQNATAMLHCSNPLCQTPNPESNKFCQKCRTLLLRRYLWAVGDSATTYQPGEIVVDRYLCKDSRIFLDTKPGLLSVNSAEIPEQFLSYLRLTPWRLHIPQVYDWVQTDAAPNAVVVFLDQVPLYALTRQADRSANSSVQTVEIEKIQPFPGLDEAWSSAKPLRQLNWLWQMANLWQPLDGEQITSSLLNPALLRVEGPLLRLLELRLEATKTTAAPLAALGQFWSRWISSAQPMIAAALQQICQQLIQGQIHNSELLLEQLDEVIARTSQSQTRQIQIATYTDQGPTRQRNEDACYPRSGIVQTLSASEAPLVIVCDGIGGHQGGDVASNLAIETIEHRIKALTLGRLNPTALTVELEKAVCVANDQISQRNDSEQRYDRQRMGTTVVLGLVRAHELYVAHVGDSRAYWITQWGCHQVTLDDDVASREVRLGYSFYRQALQQPSSGSLVQALGMGASTMLYPTVQRFILDEDSIFLLCSDGLSDNDRVEESWETEILPLLDGQTNLSTVCQRLVEVGNTRNGYDNVTVGLMYCQVAAPQSVVSEAEPPEERSTQLVGAGTGRETAIAAPSTKFRSEPSPQQDNDPSLDTVPSALKTQILERRSQQPSLIGLLLGILLLLGIGGLLAYWLFPFSLKPGAAPLAQSPTPTPETPSPEISTQPAPPLSLRTGTWIQLRRSTTANSEANRPPVLMSRPEQPSRLEQPQTSPTPSDLAQPTPQVVGSLPVGSVLEILEIVSKQGEPQQDRWVQLRVCTTPVGKSPEDPASPQASAQADRIGTQKDHSTVASGVKPQPEAKAISPSVEATPTPAKTLGTPLPPLLQPGQAGWIREAELLPLVVSSTPDQKGACTSPAKPVSLSFNTARVVSDWFL